MDGAGAQPAELAVGFAHDVHDRATTLGRRAVAEPGAFAADVPPAHDLLQQGRGLFVPFLRQGGAMEAADRMCRRDGAAGPRLGRLRVNRAHEFEGQAVRIGKPENGIAESRVRILHGNSIVGQSTPPIVQRRVSHGEAGGRHLAVPDGPSSGARPRKERENRSRRAGGVPEIEMIRTWIVEIYRELDQTEAEELCVEVHVGLRIARDGGDVVNAGDALRGRHGARSGMRYAYLFTTTPSPYQPVLEPG